MSKSKSFTVLTERDVEAVYRSLKEIDLGIQLIATIMTASLIKACPRKTRAARKTRKGK